MESSSWASKTYWAFVATTVVNYVWQVPYYVHFYAVRGRSPAPFAVMFLVTFAWFAVAAYLLYRRRRGGFTAMVAFLVLLVGFYILHNISGAFLVDLPLSDPVLFTASVLGYLNTVVAVVLLVQLVRIRRRLVAGDSAAGASTHRAVGQPAADRGTSDGPVSAGHDSRHGLHVLPAVDGRVDLRADDAGGPRGGDRRTCGRSAAVRATKTGKPL